MYLKLYRASKYQSYVIVWSYWSYFVIHWKMSDSINIGIYKPCSFFFLFLLSIQGKKDLKATARPYTFKKARKTSASLPCIEQSPPFSHLSIQVTNAAKTCDYHRKPKIKKKITQEAQPSTTFPKTYFIWGKCILKRTMIKKIFKMVLIWSMFYFCYFCFIVIAYLSIFDVVPAVPAVPAFRIPEFRRLLTPKIHQL